MFQEFTTGFEKDAFIGPAMTKGWNLLMKATKGMRKRTSRVAKDYNKSVARAVKKENPHAFAGLGKSAGMIGKNTAVLGAGLAGASYLKGKQIKKQRGLQKVGELDSIEKKILDKKTGPRIMGAAAGLGGAAGASIF